MKIEATLGWAVGMFYKVSVNGSKTETKTSFVFVDAKTTPKA